MQWHLQSGIPQPRKLKLLPDAYPPNILFAYKGDLCMIPKLMKIQVVRIMAIRPEFIHNYNDYKADIYTLSNDCWREIDIHENVPRLRDYNLFTKEKVHCKGVH